MEIPGILCMKSTSNLFVTTQTRFHGGKYYYFFFNQKSETKERVRTAQKIS